MIMKDEIKEILGKWKCYIELTKKFTSGLFGGEGFILQNAKGTGTIFLEIDGDAVIK